ncbi:MAG: 4-(cytidine 5'-diphospho)-2-C-methyl-D-erythritol kinase [Thermoleophilaceae bacterium]|nr:4-(cytidine 5'-diphospho)-2-C-methyl-D-erythritol kinase [Thermoleophilaceae bacterium]
MSAAAVHERAYAKLNLMLHVGRPGADGLHPLCSIFASIDLHDDVHVEPADSEVDSVECSGLDGPNLAEVALAGYRRRVSGLPPLAVRIEKRIPVAAGLGGGSADAAAVLRAANRIAGDPLDDEALRELGAGLGSDVPSQIDPRHALVSGVGEVVEPIDLPPFAVVLVPQREGLSTAAVYAQFDLLGGGREQLDLDRLRELAYEMVMAPVLNNDLQPAALALRPELDGVLASLRASGALGAIVSGSGPTCFGLFGARASAQTAAVTIDGALVTGLRLR